MQTRVQQRRGFEWRKLPRRQVPRPPQPLEELELGKEGRESETGFSAATVPAASRMTTAAVAGIAGKAQILQETVRELCHSPTAGTRQSLAARTDCGKSACIGVACLTPIDATGDPVRPPRASRGSTVGSSWPDFSRTRLATIPSSPCLVGLNFSHTGGRQTLAILS